MNPAVALAPNRPDDQPGQGIKSRVNKTARERFPRISKNRTVYRYREFVGTVFGWEPDRFMYRAGPVPPGTGRTGPVPTGFANPDQIPSSKY
jgi:hypothetical protein